MAGLQQGIAAMLKAEGQTSEQAAMPTYGTVVRCVGPFAVGSSDMFAQPIKLLGAFCVSVLSASSRLAKHLCGKVNNRWAVLFSL